MYAFTFLFTALETNINIVLLLNVFTTLHVQMKKHLKPEIHAMCDGLCGVTRQQKARARVWAQEAQQHDLRLCQILHLIHRYCVHLWGRQLSNQ